MKVNSIDKNSVSFNGFYNNNIIKKGLSFAENNGALFVSTTALILSATRPIAIMATPKTDIENKKTACVKSITSTLLDFAITLAVSLPIVKAVGRINTNPEKYLKKETINNLKENAKDLTDSNAYKLANQLFKLGIGIAIAAPKAVLNVLGMPYVSSLFFKQEKNEEQKNLTFKGKEKSKLSSLIGKIIDNKSVQKFSKENADSNFPMHINAIRDSLSTTVFIFGLKKSKKIKEERKNPLIYNSAIATTLSIISGYLLDFATKKPAQKFIKKLSEANKNDPNLKKYIDGFKIAKPAVILGTMYYIVIPVISTFFGERIGDKSKQEFMH
ncbi:MAG: hypothetical protein MJ230_06895 [bacterium]|nr:hypothetical protein [bacterium]